MEATALVAVVLGLVILVIAAGDSSPGVTFVPPPAASEPARAAPFADVDSSTTAPEAVDPPVAKVKESEPNPAASPTDESPVVSVRNGQRVKLHDAPGGPPVAAAGDHTEFGSPAVFSVVGNTERWVGVPTPLLPNGKLGWIKADPDKLRGGYVDYSIAVDLSERSADLLKDGVVIHSWPVTVGAPGSETPTGRFAVTDTFRGGLSPAYGCCAVALTATQPDLPSDWPGGDRIAIHGTDEPLGEAASHGCIRSADADVSRLVNTVPLGTPVRIEP